MERMGFMMTKDAKAAKMLPPNSEELKESYDIFNGGGESIPADLIVNWDQRGMRMVPVNDWIMITRGSKRVSGTGLGDKRDTFSSNKCPFLNWL